MPVDYQRRTGNGLRRLHDKMILKNSGMSNLGNEILCFVEARRWTRRLSMRECIDPGCGIAPIEVSRRCRDLPQRIILCEPVEE